MKIQRTTIAMTIKIGAVVEGQTEYYCVPKLVGKLGQVFLSPPICLKGVGERIPWEDLIRKFVVNKVKILALRHTPPPDKILVIIDREGRPECCPSLAKKCEDILSEELSQSGICVPTKMIIPNNQFECWLFAQPELLDSMNIFNVKVSELLPQEIDESNPLSIVKENLKQGKGWDKIKYGAFLAQKININDPLVLARSRSLRKFVKEVSSK